MNESLNSSKDSFDIQHLHYTQNHFDNQFDDKNDQEDIEYLQKELTRITALVSEPLMSRRKKSVKTDPVIELVEVHTDVREIESNL